MDATPSDLHFQRGLLLYQQDRNAMAEAELRLALAADPDHTTAHAVLALCLSEQNKLEAAEAEVAQAVRLDPLDAFAHYARAQVLAKQDRRADAEAAVRTAIGLNHTAASFYSLLANLRLAAGDPAGAVGAAEQGLAHDPNDAGCSALRTMALLRLGRTADATDETAEALRRDPRDPYAHAGHGWALVHAKRPAEALPHFREALRLDPTNEWARSGMIEALKARYWVYRQMLGFFLWMSRRGAGGQWAIIVGLLVTQQVLAGVARNQPAVQPFVDPVLYLFFAFVMLTWLADPLFTLLLRLNRFGRLALNAEERRQSSWVGAGVAAALVGLLVWALPTLYATIGMLWALAWSMTLIPLAAVFRCPAGWRRNLMACYTGGMVAANVGMVVCFIVAAQQVREWDLMVWLRYVRELFGALIYAGIGAGLLANGLMMTGRR